MKKPLILLILFLFTLISFAQPPAETVGNPTDSASVSTYTGWTNQGVLSFSGNAQVQNINPSNNRLGSGGGNIFFTNIADTYFEISNFSSIPIQPDGTEIIFGMYNYDTTNLNELLLEYSIDDINYLELPYKRYLAELYPPTPWTSMEAFVQSKINIKDLRIRFRQTSEKKQFRIDDIFLRYYTNLSIKLQKFTSVLNGNTVQLSWTSTTESNREIFSVEKSFDGISFTSLGKQYAKGSGTFGYSFTDRSPMNFKAYYRLQMKNDDGSFSYSNILYVQPNLTFKSILLNIYPLPSKNILNIQVQSLAAEKAEILVSDIYGKTLIKKSRSLAAGVNNSVINVQSFTKGIYFLKVVTSEGSQTRKIVVGQ